MKKHELLTALKTEREKLLATIEGLPDQVLINEGVLGEWTIKDLLAHLTVWEAELVTLIAFTRQGKRPKISITGRDVDELNAKWYAENKSRPLDRVLADFHGVRKQTIRQVETLNEADLTDSQKYPWLNNIPLWKWIAEDSFAHDAEHAVHIREWREHHDN